MERIQLSDTPMDAILKLVEGNPGATVAITECMKVYPTIDPDSMFGSMSILLNVDSFGIYGHRIWILYKDLCQQNPVKVITIMRAMQLGIVNFVEVKRAIDAIEKIIDIDVPEFNHDELLDKVRQHLPNFAKGYVNG